MQTIIANFSHVDMATFNQHKTAYSHVHMTACLRKKSEGVKNIEKEFSIIKDQEGKPWAYKQQDKDRRQPFSVTTSHSYPYIYSGSAVGDSLIGCDIERVRNFEDFFLYSFLHKNEVSFVGTLDTFSRNQMATIIWTIKESFLKALGSGLRVHPKRVDVSSVLTQRKRGRYIITFDEKGIMCTISDLNEVEGFIFCSLSIPRGALQYEGGVVFSCKKEYY